MSIAANVVESINIRTTISEEDELNRLSSVIYDSVLKSREGENSPFKIESYLIKKVNIKQADNFESFILAELGAVPDNVCYIHLSCFTYKSSILDVVKPIRFHVEIQTSTGNSQLTGISRLELADLPNTSGIQDINVDSFQFENADQIASFVIIIGHYIA